jgi:8-oxo-dGTP pyrophosphatase MutT (NUDIX family)
MTISNFLQQLRDKVGPELTLIPGVTILTFDAQNRVLLVRKCDSEMWHTPGGCIDPFETPASAAVREMWEETGLYVEPIRIVGAYSDNEIFCRQYSNDDEFICITIVFEARVIGGTTPEPQDSETLELRYFSQTEIDLLESHKWIKMILNDAFRHKNFTSFDPPTWFPPSLEN